MKKSGSRPAAEGRITKLVVGGLLLIAVYQFLFEKFGGSSKESGSDFDTVVSSGALNEKNISDDDQSLSIEVATMGQEAFSSAIVGNELIAEAKKIQDEIVPYQPGGENSAPLKVSSWNWSVEYSYAIAEGVVTNKSNSPIQNLEAIVEFTDDADRFIASGSALVEFRRLMPGQSSPFKVMKSYNPLMRSARLRFKEFTGGEIGSYQSDSEYSSSSVYTYEIQQKLKFLKFTEDRPDGVMGKGTRSAILAFEDAYGLPSTGEPSKFVNAALTVASRRRPIKE